MGNNGFGIQDKAGNRLLGIYQENLVTISNFLFEQSKR